MEVVDGGSPPLFSFSLSSFSPLVLGSSPRLSGVCRWRDGSDSAVGRPSSTPFVWIVADLACPRCRGGGPFGVAAVELTLHILATSTCSERGTRFLDKDRRDSGWLSLLVSWAFFSVAPFIDLDFGSDLRLPRSFSFGPSTGEGLRCEPFESAGFKVWAMRGECPAIPPVLKLFNKLVEGGFKVFLVTGRDEETLGRITLENLHNQGFVGYTRLIMRQTSNMGQNAKVYKSHIRKQLVAEGYNIWGNVGDQWSDLQEDCVGIRSFKIPNPLYFVP